MSSTLGQTGTKLLDRLTEAFPRDTIEVTDQSHLHAGHAGARPEGETHFAVRVTSRAFSGRSRLERQRMVIRAVGDLMNNPIHALSIEAVLPES